MLYEVITLDAAALLDALHAEGVAFGAQILDVAGLAGKTDAVPTLAAVRGQEDVSYNFV